jgi:hypothetical protein
MRILLVTALVSSLAFPSMLLADGVPSLPPLSALAGSGEGEAQSGGLGNFMPLTGLPSINLGKILLNPYAQVGYTRVGCNISFPIQVEEVIPINNQLEIGTMELFLRSSSFVTGTVGLNAIINPSLTLFAAAGGFVPKHLGAPSILPIRINNISLPSEIDFTGTKVEYWVMQAGASFGVGGGWSVLAGYLWDQFEMAAVDPQIGSAPFPNQTLRADFLTKTGVPFIGMQLNQTQLKYRFAILYSPFALCRITMASRNSEGGLSQLQYTFKNPGQFLMVNGEYDWTLSKASFISVWATGLWVKAQGDGTLEYTSTLPSISVERNKSGALMGKYSIAGGFGLGVVF